MQYLITLSLLFLFSSSFGQSPTFRALLALKHDVDNNLYDLKREEVEEGDFFQTNIFFNYYKNRNIRGSQGPEENMIFSVGYEYLIKKEIHSGSSIVFTFPIGTKKDKVNASKLELFDPINSKARKIRRKYYDFEKHNDSFRLVVEKEGLETGKVLRAYCKIESFVFDTLSVPVNVGNTSNVFISLNMPEIFSYSIPYDQLELIESEAGQMELKHFTYRAPPIVDYNVRSESFVWRVDIDAHDNQNLIFNLKSINLPVDFGASVEEILKYSKE